MPTFAGLATLVAGNSAGWAGNVIGLAGFVGTTIAVTPTSQATNIDLTTQQSNVTVGSILEASNDPRGYTVTVQTANGTATGVMKGSAPGNTDVITYTVTYGGAPVSFAGGQSLVTNANGPTPAGGVSKAVNVTINYDPTVTADTYTDTLAFITQNK